MTAQRASTAVSMFLMGLAGVYLGLAGMFSGGSDPYDIECDGQPMTYGDRCISLNGGNNGTYEELVADKRSETGAGTKAAPLITAGGVVLVIGSVVMVMRAAAPRGPMPPIAEPSDGPVDRDWWTEQGRP